MKYQDKIRIFSQKQENQNILKISGKNQESSVASKPVYRIDLKGDIDFDKVLENHFENDNRKTSTVVSSILYLK
jgi:hypothetical protein